MKKKRVVVTGIGVVSCFGSDVDLFYQKLLAGESGVRMIKEFPCDQFPTRFAAPIGELDVGPYFDKKQARRVDPFVRYGMVAGKKALEMAGISPFDPQGVDKTRCGVIVGSGMGGMEVFSQGVQTLLEKGYKRMSPFFVPYIITNIAGALLAIDLGFMGPNYSISTACATSNYCIHAAADHIRNGHADLMISGGCEAGLTPIGLGGFVACKALSERNDAPQKASRPWDKARDGFVMGEGAGVLILESLDHALARGATILAEYLGGATSCDASHITDPRADGLGVKLCIEKALEDAGCSKEQVNYINAHATSTIVGDLAEIAALRKVFGPYIRNIKINGTKSMIGHCLGAAGGMEAVATIQAIRTGKLHPTINLDDPEDDVADLNLVAHHSQECQIQVALSNSFGFGGHNASLVFAPFIL